MGRLGSPARPKHWKALVCGLAIVGVALGGSVAGAVSPTVPGAPTITSATAGDHAIRVAFTKPASDGGSPIFDYKATCASSDGGTTRSESQFRSSIQVDNLTAGKTYTCTVMARNRVGFGPPSPPSAAVVVLPILPGAPTITSVTAGDRSIRVAFTKPVSNGGSPIFNYKATCASSNGGSTRSESQFRSSIRVDGLTAGKTYTCTVAARNRVGYGPASAPSAAVVVLPIPPGAPTITSATAGVRNISVAFTAPAPNGGASPNDYKATCSSSDGGVTRSNDRHVSPVVVGGLTVGKTYTCTVLAHNNAGFGPPSAPSAPVVVLGPTVVTAPGAPAITSATAGVQSVSVAFTAPASDGGATITEYRATCSSSDGGVTRWEERNGSPILVNHLSGGKTYTCTVMARNKVGFGPPSAPSSAVVTLS